MNEQIKIKIFMKTTSVNPIYFLRNRMGKSYILKRLDASASVIKSKDSNYSYDLIIRYDQPKKPNEVKSINKMLKDLENLSYHFKKIIS